METAKTYNPKASIDANALKAVAGKFSKINRLIESAKEITPELSKNFVSFPLSDNPYKDIE